MDSVFGLGIIEKCLFEGVSEKCFFGKPFGKCVLV
jgi:hypothetical protein